MRVSPLLDACVFVSALVGAAPVGADAVAKADAHVDKSADKPADKPVEKPAAPLAEKPKAEKPKEAPTPADAPPAAVPILDESLLSSESQQIPLASPLRWSTDFPDAIEAGTDLELAWEGGNPEFGFEVYYIPRWPGQLIYRLLTIENTTASSAVWSVPDYDDFPEGTTFIFGVKDATGGPGGNWYDLTAPLPLVDPAPDASEFEAAIASKAVEEEALA